ncbi:MAG: hypothetical protein ACRCZD_10720 [Phycicoccus sp.]
MMLPRRTGAAPTVATGGPFEALLVTGYAVLAVAATARSAVQIGTRWHEAPVPYTLSGAAALTYLAVSWALRTGRSRAAAVACAVELCGVVVVGTWSAVQPGAFPDQTVWSGYGIGYGLVPSVLPAVTLWWLRRSHRPPGPSGPGPASRAEPRRAHAPEQADRPRARHADRCLPSSGPTGAAGDAHRAR